MAETREVADRLFRQIERDTAPDQMDKYDALAVLDDLASRLDGSIDALQDEITDEQGERAEDGED